VDPNSADPGFLERYAEEQEAHERALQEATSREFIRQQARAEAARLAAGNALKLPPAREDYTLEAGLRRERRSDKYTVDQLLKRNQNATLSAQFKVGKTGAACDLARCAADREPFLGRYDVDVAGNVGFFNAEMEEDDWDDYMAALGIRNPKRIRVWHLRGYRLPLTSDAGMEAAVRWLEENEVSLWVMDSHARACRWSGLNENWNDEVADLLFRVDEIKVASGVTETLWISHTGRAQHEAGAEHARGATILDDWADARWLMTKDDHESRYIRVSGRGVALDEAQVQRDEFNRLHLVGGSRRDAKTNRLVQDLVAIVTTTPGLKTTEAKNRMTATTNETERGAAVGMAEKQGLVHRVQQGAAKLLYPGPTPVPNQVNQSQPN
jgi:AAA domain